MGFNDKANDLLLVMTVCKHSFHNGVIACMLQIGESTIHRTIVAWVVFMEALFSHLNIKPDDGILLCSLPDVFIKTARGLIDIIIDLVDLSYSNLVTMII